MVYLVGCVIYWLYASGEVQIWAKVPQESQSAGPGSIGLDDLNSQKVKI